LQRLRGSAPAILKPLDAARAHIGDDDVAVLVSREPRVQGAGVDLSAAAFAPAHGAARDQAGGVGVLAVGAIGEIDRQLIGIERAAVSIIGARGFRPHETDPGVVIAVVSWAGLEGGFQVARFEA